MFGYLGGFENDLVGQLERMRREMDTLFSGRPNTAGIRSMASGTYPAINVGAAPDRVDIYLFVAGADPKALDISLQQNVLSVAGERPVESPQEAQYYRRERHDGSFRRVVNLPEDVDPDKVEARYRDGVLHITIERREAVKPRRIQVG